MVGCKINSGWAMKRRRYSVIFVGKAKKQTPLHVGYMYKAAETGIAQSVSVRPSELEAEGHQCDPRLFRSTSVSTFLCSV